MFYDNSKELERITELEEQYADAQRALDVEREKVKELEAELEEYRSIAEQQGASKAVSQLATLQAQLRQVEGENELLKSGQRYMALEKERDTLRQLVAQLPVLDMRFDSVAVGPLGWTVGGVTFGKVTEANAYSALLQYRATLAAPSPTEERS